MRLVSVTSPGVVPDPRVGVVDGDLVKVPSAQIDLLTLLQNGRGAVTEFAREVLRSPAEDLPLGAVRLHSPLPNPPTVRDFMTFEGHTVGGMGGGDRSAVAPAWWEIPTFYFTNPYAIYGPEDDIPIAPGSQRFDFELEVAAIVGRAGTNLTVEEARGHIAGYAVFVDWSARDIQMHEMTIGLGPAKGKDTASTLGPYFVNADEMDERLDGDRFDLPLSISINGIEFGRDNLSNMAWAFEEMVAYASRGTWVRPGDVLGSGTCNNGCLGELWGRHGFDAAPPLKVGDVVEVEGGLLGRTRNEIVAGAPVHPVAGARTRTEAQK